MTQLFLIRHAEGYSNLKAIAAWPKGDDGLTEPGKQQAQKLRLRLEKTGEIRPDVVFSSDLPRARQTAEIVAPLWGLPVVLDKNFREIDPGEADGMMLDDIRQKYDLKGFFQDFFQPLSPGGESHAEFGVRAALALKRVTTLHAGRTIVIFTHGSIIDASFNLFFNVSPLVPAPIGYSNKNTAITHWQYTVAAEHAPARWQLNRANDYYHLLDL